MASIDLAVDAETVEVTDVPGVDDRPDAQESPAPIDADRPEGLFRAPVLLYGGGNDGEGLYSVSLGDVDGDGMADVVVGDNAGIITLILNRGNETFADPVDVSQGIQWGFAAVADVTGDGKQDLVVGDAFDGIKVLTNLGGGKLSPTAHYAASINPSRLAVGDIDGDGKPDFAVAGRQGMGVGINQGGGVFAYKDSVNSALELFGVTVADLGGDGRADVLTTDFNGNALLVGGGKADGTLATTIRYPTTDHPLAVAVGDLNGDGKLDVAISAGQGNGMVGAEYALNVFLNQGDGTLPAARRYSLDYHTGAAAIGDFDGDGRPDIAVGGSASPSVGEVTVFLNAGDGTFGPPSRYPVRDPVTDMAVGDLNGDGRADLVILADGVYVLFRAGP